MVVIFLPSTTTFLSFTSLLLPTIFLYLPSQPKRPHSDCPSLLSSLYGSFFPRLPIVANSPPTTRSLLPLFQSDSLATSLPFSSRSDVGLRTHLQLMFSPRPDIYLFLLFFQDISRSDPPTCPASFLPRLKFLVYSSQGVRRKPGRKGPVSFFPPPPVSYPLFLTPPPF